MFTNIPIFFAEYLKKTGDLFYFKGFEAFNDNGQDALDIKFLREAQDYYLKAINIILQEYFSMDISEDFSKIFLNPIACILSKSFETLKKLKFQGTALTNLKPRS